MICGPCQEAGDKNAIALRLDGKLDGILIDQLLRAHKRCESPDCGCQHKVGRWVDQ